MEVVEETEQGSKGRKRQRKNQVKRLGLRKNTPAVAITNHMECCKKKCLQKFTPEHLTQVRSTFLGLTYDQQNISLDGLLHRVKLKNRVVIKEKLFQPLLLVVKELAGLQQKKVCLALNTLFEMNLV